MNYELTIAQVSDWLLGSAQVDADQNSNAEA